MIHLPAATLPRRVVGRARHRSGITDDVMPRGRLASPRRGESVAPRVEIQRTGANVNEVGDDLALDEASGSRRRQGPPATESHRAAAAG